MISIIYSFHNRLEYNKITFPKFLYECLRDVGLIDNIFIYDDNSTDGSTEFIQNIINKFDYSILNIHFIKKVIGNSTFQIINTVENCKSKYIVKVDNDILIPDHYFNTLLKTIIDNDEYGFLMAIENNNNFPQNINVDKLVIEVPHIGGVGIFKKEIFNKITLKSENKFFGFTDFQNKAKEYGYKTGKINFITVVNLDGSPLYSRVNEYQEKGFSRNLFENTDSIIDGC
jgi:glycosyltransferase involved in cell wall biosynthesis